MSLKTAGAPSTNPPAVIGRAWASLMAACAAPVLMPVCCLLGGFSRSSCAKTTFKSKTEDKVRLSAPARAREGAIVWQETNSSSNGLSTRANFLILNADLQSCDSQRVDPYLGWAARHRADRSGRRGDGPA